MIQNDRLLRVLSGERVDRPPIWLMRQAGRYLPEYRALREQAGSFWSLCKTPDLAAEAAMLPLNRYDLDAAILFSDILTIPDAMGLTVDFIPSEGPVFREPLRRESDVDNLSSADMGRLRYVFDAVRATKSRLSGRLPLIGFSGSPFTLACYMVEGKTSRDFPAIRRLIAARPNSAKRLLDLLTQSVIDCLRHQIEAGVDAVMIFDTWGNVLSEADFQTFSLPCLTRVADAVKALKTPVTVFTKSVQDAVFRALSSAGFDAVGVTWTANMARLRSGVLNPAVALQGNLDPALLACDASVIGGAVDAMMAQIDPGRHIVNLGHGIPPDTPPDGVARFIEAVRAHA